MPREAAFYKAGRLFPNNKTMWIKKIPVNYKDMSSFCYNNVFLWQKDNVFVMDNHMSALWCWMQVCDSKKRYNFMHIDRHYDLMDCFQDEDLETLRLNHQIDYLTYISQMRGDKQFKVYRWDNYIYAGYVLQPQWFNTNLFLTHKDGSNEPSWGHKPLRIREENPLFMEWCVQQYIEEPYKYLDGFKGNDYKLTWIVNLDLDVFYTGDSHIKIFSDEYIRKIAELLQRNLSNIVVLTIAVSPECLGGDSLNEKWSNGFRILDVMSDKLECLKEFKVDCEKTLQS